MKTHLHNAPLCVREPLEYRRGSLVDAQGCAVLPTMKTPEQYEAEIADLKELIRKMQAQLTAALKTVAEDRMKHVDKPMITR
jgi:hypothetical protein